MRRLEGKAILVTGAAGAIGGATALRLAEEGARLVLADRETALAGVPLDAIAATGATRPHVVAYDAGSAASSAALVGEASAALGGLDAVCNVAGAYAKVRSTELTDADWDRQLQVNLSSVFTISRTAIPHLARTGGAVVSTSSLAAFEGQAYATAYAVAKAGVIVMMKSLAAEYASTGIRFNAICPGGIRSGMSTVAAVPDADPDLAFRRSKLKGFEGGLGEPRDVAAAFAYLVSEDARFVSGTALVVDGAQFVL